MFSMLFSLLDCIFATCKIQKLQHISSGTQAQMSVCSRDFQQQIAHPLPISVVSRNSVEKSLFPNQFANAMFKEEE